MKKLKDIFGEIPLLYPLEDDIAYRACVAKGKIVYLYEKPLFSLVIISMTPDEDSKRYTAFYGVGISEYDFKKFYEVKRIHPYLVCKFIREQERTEIDKELWQDFNDKLLIRDL